MASRSMKILLYDLLRFDSLLPAHGLATKGKASGIKPRKTRNQKKALYNRRPPTCIHQHSSPAPRHPPNPLLCRVMADTTPCSSSAVPYTSTLPPLPTTLPATQPGQLHQRFHPSRSHRFIIRCTFQLYRGRVRERHSLELSIDKILPG